LGEKVGVLDHDESTAIMLKKHRSARTFGSWGLEWQRCVNVAALVVLAVGRRCSGGRLERPGQVAPLWQHGITAHVTAAESLELERVARGIIAFREETTWRGQSGIKTDRELR
jgi:hypothetical protein